MTVVYRCCECGWDTTHYADIDAHEDQTEPGHLVVADA